MLCNPCCRLRYKLIKYGTGSEVADQLFELTSDPGEMDNLAAHSSYRPILEVLEKQLNSVVDYAEV